MSRRLNINDIERIENTASAAAVIVTGTWTDSGSLACAIVVTADKIVSDAACL